jgi:hypothetical protein
VRETRRLFRRAETWPFVNSAKFTRQRRNNRAQPAHYAVVEQSLDGMKQKTREAGHLHRRLSLSVKITTAASRFLSPIAMHEPVASEMQILADNSRRQIAAPSARGCLMVFFFFFKCGLLSPERCQMFIMCNYDICDTQE